MAVVNITPQKLTRNSLAKMAMTDFTAVNVADGAAVPMYNDSRQLIVFYNSGSSAVTATVVKGNALQGAGSDLNTVVDPGSFVFALVESGLYGNTSGELRGKIFVKGSATGLKVAAYHLPE